MVFEKDRCGNFKGYPEKKRRMETDWDGSVRLIPLTQGQAAIVDEADYEELSKYKWFAIRDGRTFYAARRDKSKRIIMHRELMDAPRGMIVDHIDHNGLNNTRVNLRICTVAENVRNRRAVKGRTSKYKGVMYIKRLKVYYAKICFEGQKYHLGSFKDEVEAARVYDAKAKELFGEFACLNFPKKRA